jgi:hypothetical protein
MPDLAADCPCCGALPNTCRPALRPAATASSTATFLLLSPVIPGTKPIGTISLQVGMDEKTRRR